MTEIVDDLHQGRLGDIESLRDVLDCRQLTTLKVESGLAETTVRLTLHTDFALRVLIQVGLNDGVKRTFLQLASMSAYDPKQKWNWG